MNKDVHLLRFVILTLTILFALSYNIVVRVNSIPLGSNSMELARILGHELAGSSKASPTGSSSPVLKGILGHNIHGMNKILYLL